MNWRERVVIDPAVLVGKPVIRGTQISVELVIDMLARGYSKEQILEQYDHLTAENIQACLAYASESLRSERVYAMPVLDPIVRILADENFPGPILRDLRRQGHDVTSVKESMRGARELAYRFGLLGTSGVILFRLSGPKPKIYNARALAALESGIDQMGGRTLTMPQVSVGIIK